MRLAIENEQHWHQLRDQREGASDAPIHFGVGYISPFQRWHQRKGTLPKEDFSDNERVVLGRHLEAGIAGAAQELYGDKLVKATAYYTDDEINGYLGATPDYFMDREDSDTVVEIKNCSYGTFRDDFPIGDDGVTDPPLRFLIQCQAQMAATGAKHAKLIVLTAGNRILNFDVPRHEPAISSLRSKIVAFQESLDRNEEPPAEMPVDLSAAKVVWHAGEGQVDLRGDPDIEGWLTQITELRQLRHKIEADTDAIEGEVLSYCTRNGFAAIRANGGRISCKQREAKPARMVEFKAQPPKIELRITPVKG